MTPDTNTLLERVRNLSPEQQDTLVHILDALEMAAPGTGPKGQKRPLTALEFCGMWADREDMKDSAAWVRKIRETEWRRNIDSTNDPGRH
ncbi:MAG: hypothetical protein HUU46_22785 [Candidatus Hydrogenedentes bacterium]|nr:hypothetical protein [Candidatus Hydrogenedentota bacterium]